MSGWRKQQIKDLQMFIIGIDPGASGAVAILEKAAS